MYQVGTLPAYLSAADLDFGRVTHIYFIQTVRYGLISKEDIDLVSANLTGIVNHAVGVIIVAGNLGLGIARSLSEESTCSVG